MTIPTLRTWADDLAPAIPSLFSGIHNLINPDAKNVRQLDMMLQQDPTLITKISNMTPQEREALINGLGFKDARKASAITNAGTGAELQARYDKDFADASLTPDQKTQKLAKTSEVDTQENITMGREAFALDKKSKETQIKATETGMAHTEQEIEIGKQRLKDNENKLKEYEAGFLKYPNLSLVDIHKARDDYLLGKIDPLLAQRLPPEMMKSFEQYAELNKQRVMISAQFGLANLKTNAEKQASVKMAMDDHDNAFRALQDAQKQYAGYSGMEGFKKEMIAKTSPESQKALDQDKAMATSALNEAQARYQKAQIMYNNVRSYFDPTGEQPKGEDRTTPLPTVTATADASSKKIEQLAATYKSLSGQAKARFKIDLLSDRTRTEAEKKIILGIK